MRVVCGRCGIGQELGRVLPGRQVCMYCGMKVDGEEQAVGMEDVLAVERRRAAPFVAEERERCARVVDRTGQRWLADDIRGGK